MKARTLIFLSGAALILLLVVVGVAHMQQSLARRSSPRQEQGTTGRKHINISSPKIPLHVSAVRNLDASDWIQKLEVEIENKSNRPIYYVLVLLSFPDIPKSIELDGAPRGVVSLLRYGRKDFFLHPEALAKPEDVPIAPTERVVLRMDASESEGLKRYLSNHNLPDSIIKKVRVRIDSFGFGDGSGYREGEVPFSPRSTSQNEPPAADRGGTVRLLKARYASILQHGCGGQSWPTCGK